MELLNINSNDFQGVSFYQIRQLASCGQLLKQIGTQTLQEDHVNALKNLRDKINSIETSFIYYHPSICRWILDLVLLRHCKRLRLKKIIPRVRAAIDDILRSQQLSQTTSTSKEHAAGNVKGLVSHKFESDRTKITNDLKNVSREQFVKEKVSNEDPSNV